MSFRLTIFKECPNFRDYRGPAAWQGKQNPSSIKLNADYFSSLDWAYSFMHNQELTLTSFDTNKMLFAQFILNPRLRRWNFVESEMQVYLTELEAARVDEKGDVLEEDCRAPVPQLRMTADEMNEWIKELKVTIVDVPSPRENHGTPGPSSVVKIEHSGGDGVVGGSAFVDLEYSDYTDYIIGLE